MNDWLRQQINNTEGLFAVLTNQVLDQNKINTPLEEAQKTTINQQQQQINQQKQELETQAKVNTGLAKLGLHLVSANEEAKSNGIRNTILGVLSAGLLTNAAAPVAFISQLDFIPNPPPAEVQGNAQKETLTDLEKNVSGMLQEQYPGYKALPEAHRQYLENHILSQSGAVSDVSGFPHSGTSIQDTATKQGKINQVTLPIPDSGDIHKILSFAFGNPENLNKTVPQYTMTQEELTQTLNGN